MAFAAALRNLFLRGKGGAHAAGDEFYDELADALIAGDVSQAVAAAYTDVLMAQCKGGADEGAVRDKLRDMIAMDVSGVELVPQQGKTNIWMLLGVNGVGKTTTCAKIAGMFKARSADGADTLVMAAADTFRAAAIEQLVMHGERLGVRVVHHQMGGDPSAVVYDAAEAVRAAGGGLVIADTAGRLHNKEGLVRELGKINRTCMSRSDEGCCKKILVLDATTGQNAVRQAEVFNEAVGVDAVVLAKSDATAKGGAVITIGHTLHIPVAFTGYGEKYSDIKVFNASSFIKEFVGEE